MQDDLERCTKIPGRPMGRLTAALGVAHNENTVALANINFDFSLFRVDAPPEYRALGVNLSANRRQEAESGTPHRTARKLGALFEGVLPHVPELARAYGRRVSEISSYQIHNPSENSASGPFVAHMGADGTAIWAAATSGPGAIPILMLTCMLARIWTAPEATSIWVEIVACRRREIEINCTGDEAKDYVLLQAAQQDLTRSSLADWDASARAWLRTADEAKQLEQAQLMLIINNLHIPVSNNMSVYHSVLESSKAALVSMESISNGMPQRVQSGALLLGLSAWHLYPDMVVHGSVTKTIRQKDQLVPPGTMITLGLESIADSDTGVYWSLPLAHLRFYGDPVQSIRSTGHDASRIPSEQLVYVVLGVIFRNWVRTSSMIPLALRWLSKFYRCISRAIEVEDREAESIRCLFEGCGWLNILLSSVESFNKLHKREREVAIKLMAAGFRRFEEMLEKKNHLPRVFGLLNGRNLFPLLKSDMVEERIKILRGVAAQQKANLGDMVIRYKRHDSQEFIGTREDTGLPEDYFSPRSEELYEYASALPYVRGSAERDHCGDCSRIEKHKRWIAMVLGPDSNDGPLPKSPYNASGYTAPCQGECFPDECSRHSVYFKSAFDGYKDYQDVSLDFSGEAGRRDKVHEEGISGGGACTGKALGAGHGKVEVEKPSVPLEEVNYGKRANEILAIGEDCVQEDLTSFKEYYRSLRDSGRTVRNEYSRHYKVAWETKYEASCIYLRDAPWGPGGRSLTFVYGDADSAALYKVSSPELPDDIRNEIEMDELERLLEQDTLDVSRLIEHIGRYNRAPYENLGSSLKAFASLINVYQFLPEATIALKIACKPLHEASWARHAAARKVAHMSVGYTSTEATMEKHAPQKDAWSWALSLSETFACITMFESGTYDLDPSTLEYVFAVSSSNSLFVAAPLLNDPSQAYNDNVVHRVVGNIGRAGIAMLIAPQDPRTRKVETDTWELISHAPFDGKLEDSFQNTSLHLSFTQYTMPVNTGDSGGQDIEAFFLESLISVYDRDKWVADLDVLKMLRSPLFHRLVTMEDSHHHLLVTPRIRFDLIAIDNWEELLDREEVFTLVRAYRNPTARLATAAISVRQGRLTIILPDDICLACHVYRPYDLATTFIA